MELMTYQIDAFASEVFSGNPAAVIPLKQWLPDSTMQAIALENQLSETAFFVIKGETIELRWFTPKIEVDLCGHATLATAHVLFAETLWEGETLSFETRSGILTVTRDGDGYSMNFPVDRPEPVSGFQEPIARALGVSPETVLKGRHDLVAILSREEEVQQLDPDFREIAGLPSRGLLVSAPGDEVDFVSRCFFPKTGIDEDPVTGSAHTTLAPYWSEKWERNSLKAEQISARGGSMTCRLDGDRIELAGKAVTFLRGVIQIPNSD